MAKEGNGPLFYIFLGCGGLAIFGILGIGGCVYLLYSMVKPPADATHAFFQKINAGDVDGAYGMMTKELQADLDKATLTRRVPLWKSTDVTLNNRDVDNNVATMAGSITLTDGTTYPLTVTLIETGDAWLLTSIQIKGWAEPGTGAEKGADKEQTSTTGQSSSEWWIEYGQNGDVFQIRADGKKSATRVRRMPPPARRRYRTTKLSPDGKRWAYISAKDGDAEIWVCDLEGSNAKTLTNNNAIDNMPNWLPDGKGLIFGSTRTGVWQIWRMDEDGRNAIQLTHHVNGAWCPEISPKGDRVAYLIKKRKERVSKAPEYDLGVVSVDGKGHEIIIRGQRILSHVWGPTGNTLAYSVPGQMIIYDHKRRESIRTFQFKKIDENLEFHGASYLSWRPDGKAIVSKIHFLGGLGGEGPPILGDHEIFILPITGTEKDVRILSFGAGVIPIRWIQK